MNTGDYANDVFVSSSAHGSGGEAFQDYLLNSQYSRINGTLFLPFNTRSTLRTGNHLIILGDGVEIYRSPEIRAGSFPVEFDVDVTGVTVLRMQFHFGEGTWNSTSLGISDTQLIR